MGFVLCEFGVPLTNGAALPPFLLHLTIGEVAIESVFGLSVVSLVLQQTLLLLLLLDDDADDNVVVDVVVIVVAIKLLTGCDTVVGVIVLQISCVFDVVTLVLLAVVVAVVADVLGGCDGNGYCNGLMTGVEVPLLADGLLYGGLFIGDDPLPSRC